MTKKNMKKELSEKSIGDEIEEYLIDVGKGMFESAREIISRKKCNKCKKSDKLKLVPLYNDAYPLPTEMVAYCDRCHTSESLIIRDKDKKIRHHMRKIQKMVERANKINIDKVKK